MSEGRELLREGLLALQTSQLALAALTAALNARARGLALPAPLARPLDDVLDALGVRAALAALPGEQVLPLLGELRTYAASAASLAGSAPPEPGWRASDPELLQAAGDVSSELAPAIARRIGPMLVGLLERLAAPGAAFLDVGAGVAALSIAMARAFPALQVTGIEPWAPALDLGRQRVREAGLEARIALRAQGGEQLDDVAAFDLAWVPSLFIPGAALASLCPRVRRALRPAWLLMPVLRAPQDPLVASVSRLRCALWGGAGLEVEAGRALLETSGFVQVRALPAAPASCTALLAARAPG